MLVYGLVLGFEVVYEGIVIIGCYDNDYFDFKVEQEEIVQVVIDCGDLCVVILCFIVVYGLGGYFELQVF